MKAYFDYAATTPTDPMVIEAMQPFFFERFGNASSPHHWGRDAQSALEDAREATAEFIGAKPEEIIFNSGATEGNNHAIFGVARTLRNKGNHIIISSIEHHAVLEPVEQLEKDGFKVTRVDVDRLGIIDPNEVKKAITSQTILIAVMHANNEIGTIQPVEAIGKIAKEANVLFLVDACQTVGHIPVNVNVINADLLTFSAHKCYGPKGVGALYVRVKTPISKFIFGGDQEKDRRASTQNVAGAVGLGKALDLCHVKMPEETIFQTELRNILINEIPKRIYRSVENGHSTLRLPNNAHFSFRDVQSEAILMRLDMIGIAASMGSACTSGAMEASHVLRALGHDDNLAYGSLRITIGRWTTSEEVDYLLEELPRIISELRV